MREITASDVAPTGQAFRRDWGGQYVVVAVTAALAQQAMDLAQRHGLRGYDVMHPGY